MIPYTRVAGSYTLTFSVTHPDLTSVVVTSVAISVTVRNNCDDGSVSLINLLGAPVVPYRTKPTFSLSQMTTSMLTEQKCINMSTGSVLNFKLR